MAMTASWIPLVSAVSCCCGVMTPYATSFWLANDNEWYSARRPSSVELSSEVIDVAHIRSTLWRMLAFSSLNCEQEMKEYLFFICLRLYSLKDKQLKIQHQSCSDVNHASWCIYDAPLLKLNVLLCCVSFRLQLECKKCKNEDLKILGCVGGGVFYTLNIASYSHNASTEWTN